MMWRYFVVYVCVALTAGVGFGYLAGGAAKLGGPEDAAVSTPRERPVLGAVTTIAAMLTIGILAALLVA
ncbi:MAG TPA: hypothetical protein VKA83_09285 [Methylomirabilota bacterium]|nr:hypothetical protein [Methylomirabilota bacterium]